MSNEEIQAYKLVIGAMCLSTAFFGGWVLGVLT
jgi:hypothetical protein